MCRNTTRTLPIPTSLLCRKEVLVWGTVKFKPRFHHSKCTSGVKINHNQELLFIHTVFFLGCQLGIYFLIGIFSCLYVCVSVYVCVCLGCVNVCVCVCVCFCVYLWCVCVQFRGQPLLVFLGSHPPCFLRQSVPGTQGCPTRLNCGEASPFLYLSALGLQVQGTMLGFSLKAGD